jgi:hypothetical protein
MTFSPLYYGYCKAAKRKAAFEPEWIVRPKPGIKPGKSKGFYIKQGGEPKGAFYG